MRRRVSESSRDGLIVFKRTESNGFFFHRLVSIRLDLMYLGRIGLSADSIRPYIDVARGRFNPPFCYFISTGRKCFPFPDRNRYQ